MAKYPIRIVTKKPHLIERIPSEFIAKHPCNTLLFVGAGASKDFGFPLMDGFFEEFFSGFFDIHEKLQNGEFPPDAQGEEFIAELLYFLIKDGGPMNLEALLEHAQGRLDVLKGKGESEDPKLVEAFNFLLASETGFKASATVGRTKVFSGDFISKYVAKFEDAILTISESLYRVYDKDVRNEGQRISDRYHPIFSLLDSINKENIAVFTTNYDRCLDYYIQDHCGSFRRAPVTCFKNFNPRAETGGYRDLKFTQIADVATYNEVSDGALISYFNLHGSVAWVPKFGDVFYEEEPKGAREFSGEQIPLAVPVVSKGENKPLICNLMYRFLFTILKDANLRRILSIGFSFNDEEIVNAMGEALTERNVELIAVNPDFYPSLNKYLAGVPGKQIKVIKHKFGDREVLPLLHKYMKE